MAATPWVLVTFGEAGVNDLITTDELPFMPPKALADLVS
jgi:hypothetical protein